MHQIEIASSPTTILNQTSAWDSLSAGIPFRQTIWLRPWWRHLDQDRERVLITAKSTNGELKGLLLLLRASQSKTTRSRKLESAAGGKLCTDHTSILAAPGFEDRVSREFADFLLDHQSDSNIAWDQIRLEGTLAGDPATRSFIDQFTERSANVRVASRMSAWFKTCSPTWEAYLASSSKKLRYNQRSLLRTFDDAARGLSLITQHDSESVTRYLDRLIDLHQAHWTSQGEPGTFADSEMRRFIHEVAHEALSQGKLFFPVLTQRNESTGDEEVVAAQFCLIGEDKRHYCFSTAVNYAHSKLSPGSMLNAVIIRYLHEQKAPGIDWLRGDETYKSRNSAIAIPLLETTIFAPTLHGKLSCARHDAEFAARQTARALWKRPLVQKWSIEEAFSEKWAVNLPKPMLPPSVTTPATATVIPSGIPALPMPTDSQMALS